MSILRRIGLAISLLGLVVVLLSGLVVVDTGEVMVVQRLGKALATPLRPGLHWSLPLGLDRLDRVRTDEIQRLVLGGAGIPDAAEAPGLGEFLTGDLNLAGVEAIVQYRVADPTAFVLFGERVQEFLKEAAAARLSQALASRTIDEALGDERLAIATELLNVLSGDLDKARVGLEILDVSLADVQPPWEVAPAFDEAQSARSQADQRLEEAKGYQTRTLAVAHAEAQTRLDRAEAASHRAVTLAKAEADRFQALRQSLSGHRALAIRRLHETTIRERLAEVGQTILLTPNEPIDLSIIQPTTPSTELGSTNSR